MATITLGSGADDYPDWTTMQLTESEGAGDTVSFRKGDTFREQITVPASGASDNRITYTAHGAGADPIITAADLVTSWTQYSDTAAYFNTDFEGDSEGANPGDFDSIVETNGTCNAEAAGKKNGTYGMRVTHTGDTCVAHAVKDWGSPVGDARVSFWCRYSNDTWSGALAGNLLELRDQADNRLNGKITWQHNGGNFGIRGRVYNDVGASEDTAWIQLTTNTWYWINYEWYSGASTTGYARIRVNNGGWETTALVDNDDTYNEVDQIKIGIVTGGANMDSIDLDFDDISVDDQTRTAPPTGPSNCYYATLTTECNWVYHGSTKLTENDGATTGVGSNEWDWDTNKLYINIGGDPSAQTIEASQRDYAVGDNNTTRTYITLNGLDLRYCNGSLGTVTIQNGSSNYWTIQNSNISLGKFGVVCVADYPTISSSTIESNNNHGIWIHANSTGGTIDSNTIQSQINGHGVYIQGTSTTVSNNDITDNDYNGVYIDGENNPGTEAINNIVEYNKIHANGQCVTYGDTSQNWELYTAWGNSNTFRYNLVYDADTVDGNCICVWEAQDNLIYNNVCYNAQAANPHGAGIYLEEDTPIQQQECANNIFKNNIVSDCRVQVSFSDDIGADNLQGNVFDYNCYYIGTGTYLAYAGGYKSFAQWKAMTGSPDSNSMDSDPLFIDAANDKLSLQSTSPCIDAGTDVSLTTDYAGSAVPAPSGGSFDIGAFEYVKMAPAVATITASAPSVTPTVQYNSAVSTGGAMGMGIGMGM